MIQMRTSPTTIPSQPIASRSFLHWTISPGRSTKRQLILVIGPSFRSGQIDLSACVNGLTPHFYGGKLSGQVRVAGRDPVALGPQGMAHIVGMVFQDPETQFVADQVEDAGRPLAWKTRPCRRP